MESCGCDVGDDLVRDIVAVIDRHSTLGKMSDKDKHDVAEVAVFDLICLYRDKFRG